MGTLAVPAHHHRNTTKVDHKPFKSKHATKGALKEAAKGKVGGEDRGTRKTPHQQAMSKLARRNQAKQLRLHHREKQDHEAHIFQGPNAAAKHIAVVPLSQNVDVHAAIARLNASVGEQPRTENLDVSNFVSVHVERFKRGLLYMPSSTDLFQALDICKLADWVVFVMAADGEIGEQESAFIRAIEGQGITSATVVVQNLEANVATSKRPKHLTELRSRLQRYFPDLEKVHSLDSVPDCSNLTRSLCTAATRGIRWRDSRNWMLVDQVRWSDSGANAETSNVILEGIVRGRNLNPDRLVHVAGWGTYQIKQATEVPRQKHKRKADEMSVEEEGKVWLPSADQDDLAELAPETVEMTDRPHAAEGNEQKGVLLDDHHYFSDHDPRDLQKPTKLPPGTSDYQAAWFLGDVVDSDSDFEDVEEQQIDDAMDDLNLGPEDGITHDLPDAQTEAGGTEYPASEMHVDADEEEESRQLQEFRASRKKEADEDLEFPDEIELHPDVLARERLQKYRGLKSLRTSEWNTAEDAPYEPAEYRRLLQIPEYRKSYNIVSKESLAGGIPAGTRVQLELQNVPVIYRAQKAPISAFSLLKHEHKHTVVNLHLSISSDYGHPVRSKEELMVQIGHRRFNINPVFSGAGQTPNDVHKFDRFLHPGRIAVATFVGPLTWGPVPVLVFRQKSPQPPTQPNEKTQDEAAPELVDSSTSTSTSTSTELIGSATVIAPSSSRVIAKRIVLTGHPYKIHRKLVTIRYMFFNRPDVEWFKALPLWTKRGRQGYIKEPLGTHGYFKATFDEAGRVNGMDAVGVSLYKRVYPRTARPVE